MDALLNSIAEGWSWKLGEPVEVVATNVFGNAIVKNKAGHYFRIMPEEWSCELIVGSAAELEKKRRSAEFTLDWEMKPIVAVAEKAHGPVADGQVYYLVVPGVLGGTYTEENIRKISLHEVLAYCGDMARQINDVPDGESVVIVPTEKEPKHPRGSTLT
jgi:hypothetical protein